MKNSEIMNNKVNESRYNNINNALWLLSKAFSKKEFKKNEKISFNTVIDFYEKNKKNNIENNEPFMKMFVFVYSHLLKYYKTDVYNNNVQKKMYDLLNKPIDYFIEKITEELNDSELQKIKNKKELEDFIKKPKPYEKENVKNQLEYIINNFVNFYKK